MPDFESDHHLLSSAVGADGHAFGVNFVSGSYCSQPSNNSIASATAFCFDLYNKQVELINLSSTHISTTLSGPVSIAPVTITVGTPLTFNLFYNATTTNLSVKITNGINTFTTNYSINYATYESTSSYFSLTGGSGASTANQTISGLLVLGSIF